MPGKILLPSPWSLGHFKRTCQTGRPHQQLVVKASDRLWDPPPAAFDFRAESSRATADFVYRKHPGLKPLLDQGDTLYRLQTKACLCYILCAQKHCTFCRRSPRHTSSCRLCREKRGWLPGSSRTPVRQHCPSCARHQCVTALQLRRNSCLQAWGFTQAC